MKRLKWRLLIVDDDADQRLVCWQGLRKHLLAEVDFVASALEAFVLIEDRPYDLVVTDLNMPQISGQEFFERLAKTHPGLPVIVLTGNPSQESICSGLNHQIRAYLGKPIQMRNLALKIEEVLSADSAAVPAADGPAAALESVEERLDALQFDRNSLGGATPPAADAFEKHWQNLTRLKDALAVLREVLDERHLL